MAIRGLKDVEGEDKGGDRVEEVEEITRRKRRASGELILAKAALQTYTETSTEASTETSVVSDAPLVGIEDIDPDFVKDSGADADGEEEAVQPVKAKIPLSGGTAGGHQGAGGRGGR